MPEAGVEPARALNGPRDFESLASASSATPAMFKSSFVFLVARYELKYTNYNPNPSNF